MTAYPHYCRECEMLYYGLIEGQFKPCPRCGEEDNINAVFGDEE